MLEDGTVVGDGENAAEAIRRKEHGWGTLGALSAGPLPSGKPQHSAIKRGPRTARPVGHEITPTNDLHDLTGSDGQSLEGSSWGGERVTFTHNI